MDFTVKHVDDFVQYLYEKIQDFAHIMVVPSTMHDFDAAKFMPVDCDKTKRDITVKISFSTHNVICSIHYRNHFDKYRTIRCNDYSVLYLDNDNSVALHKSKVEKLVEEIKKVSFEFILSI